MNIGMEASHHLLMFLFLLHEHKQGLGLETCSFKAQGVLGLYIFSWVFSILSSPGLTMKTSLGKQLLSIFSWWANQLF
jgi:hypothetical protein